MRLVFKKYIANKILNLINEAAEKNLKIEKIVVTQDEAKQLEFELEHMILRLPYNTLFGYKLEIEQ